MMGSIRPAIIEAMPPPPEEPELLSSIVRIFKDIPETCGIDIFGEIYCLQKAVTLSRIFRLLAAVIASRDGIIMSFLHVSAAASRKTV